MKNYVIIITVAFLGLLCLLGCITAHFYRQYELIVKTCNELQEQNDLMSKEIHSVTDAVKEEVASTNDALEDVVNDQLELNEEIKLIKEDTKKEIIDTKKDMTENPTGSVNSELSSSIAEISDDDSMVFSATRDDGSTSEDVIIETPEPMGVYEEEQTYMRELSENDRWYLERMVETETYGADMMSKTHVASVALNRVDSGKWGGSVQAVVTAPNQFAYFRTSISDSTKEAVDYVLMYGDTAQGALFFHSGGYTSTFCGRPCIFGDDVGHYFY